jgi:hypothetical protein
MDFIEHALDWMRSVENAPLSGWAQAIGAVLAILIAIAVPAYQRHSQLLDARRGLASLNLVLASSCGFLLNDVVVFLKGLIEKDNMPRAEFRDDTQINDMLERIRALEAREISHARIISLYAARGALILTNRELQQPFLQDRGLHEKEILLLKKRIASVDERLSITNYDSDFSIGRARSAYLAWPARPIVGAILTCMAFRKHRSLRVADRLFGTR